MSILDSIEKLRLDSKLQKSKHFNAADRKRGQSYWFGIPVVVISVILGSALFTEFLDRDIFKIGGAVLAFLSALLVSLQTFMNPKESEEGHRSVGNRYIVISRKSGHLIEKYNDKLLSLGDINSAYEELHEEYFAINREAESFPTIKRDLEHAQNMAISKIT